MEVAENGNGIVTTRTFLGSVTRVGVQLSGVVAPAASHIARAPFGAECWCLGVS